MTPLVKMHTLGSDFIPEPIHAGGLRYHGMSPLVSLLKEHGAIEAQAVHQRACFEAGVTFARAEGILPAPEPTHAIKVAIDEALAAQGGGRGAGDPVQPVRPRPLRPVGLRAATSPGTLEDYEYPAEKVEAALAAPAGGRLSAGAGADEGWVASGDGGDPPRPPARVAGAPWAAHRQHHRAAVRRRIRHAP